MAKKIVRDSLRKHPFLLALRPLGTSPREMSPAVKSEEKRMFRRLCQGRRWAGSYLLLLPKLSNVKSRGAI